MRSISEADYRRGGHTAILAVLDEARAANDPVVHMEALSQVHHCLLGPGHGARRRALAEELIGAAAGAGHRRHLMTGLLWLVADLFLDADPHAERRLGELRALLAEQDHLAIGYVTHAIEVMLAIRTGRLADAEQLAKECLERGVKAGDADADAWYGAQLVAIRWYQGRLPELLPVLTELANSPTLSAVDNSFLAAFAVAHLCEAVHRNLGLGHWPAVIASRLRLAEALERRGDPDDIDTAQEQRAEAAEVAATLAVGVALVPALVSAPSGVAVCTRHGVKWRIEVGIRSVLVDHSVGMLHLSVLIANPGVEIPAIDLVTGMDVLGQAARTSGMPAQQVLDRTAIRQYRHRLALAPRTDRRAGVGRCPRSGRPRSRRT